MSKYCRYCGTLLKDGAAFCGGCGREVPKQEIKMEAPARPRFCRMCGRELRPGVKFCAECGWEVGTALKSESDMLPEQETRPGKPVKTGKKRIFVPVTAAVLAIAVFMCFVYPGFVRTGLSGGHGGTQTVSGSGTQTVASVPHGNSKPVNMETPYGITITAEADALDRDREFKIIPATEKQYDEIDRAICEAVGNPEFILGAWELDAGLGDDEFLPGHYTMDISLKKMGLDESDYESLRFYRIDDSGKCYEYVTALNGDTVTIESRQNCFITITLAVPSLTSLLASAAVGTALGMAVHDYQLVSESGAYFNSKASCYDLVYKKKAVMAVMLDADTFLPEIEKSLKDLYEDLIRKARAEAAGQVSEEEHLKGKSLAEVQREICEMANDPQREAEGARIREKLKERCETLKDKMVDNDPTYKKIKDEIEKYKEIGQDPETRPKLDAVDRVCDYALMAWGWMDEMGLKMPDYQFRIELSGVDKKAYGTTNSPFYGNPYMVISMPRAIGTDARTCDILRCTICHEMFHAVQRNYVSKRFATDKFDEMTAQDVEWMAFEHFSKVGDKPVTSSKQSVLDNLDNLSFFAIPLNDTGVSYAEGSITSESSSSAYPIAPFVRYLRLQQKTDYPTVLSNYQGLSGICDVTTVLKGAYGIGTDERLTEYYHKFAESYKDEFLKEAEKSSVSEVFAPSLTLSSKEGKAAAGLCNKNYTIRVRRVSLSADFEKMPQYAVVLKTDDGFADKMSDLSIVPLNMETDKEYREFDGGLFFEPKFWTEDDVLYLMEADGGTAGTSDVSDYSGYTLYIMEKPEAPEVEVLGTELSVLLPPFSKRPSCDVVDSYVITLKTGNDIVMQERMGKKSISEPVPMDISDLRIKGRSLTDDEMRELTLVIQECVTGTFEEGEPCEGCFGPESDPVSVYDDIYGTWEIQSAMQNYSNPLFDQYVGSMGDLAGSLGGFGEGLGQYVDEYNSIQGSYANAVTNGRMTIRPSETKGMVEADLEFEGAPKQTYIGAYDRVTKKLKLDPKDTGYTDSGGNTYDLRDFGLATSIELLFSTGINPKNPGTTVMTFSGESSMDNAFVSYKTVLTGFRISSRY